VKRRIVHLGKKNINISAFFDVTLTDPTGAKFLISFSRSVVQVLGDRYFYPNHQGIGPIPMATLPTMIKRHESCVSVFIPAHHNR
jgi:hypothetical protein